MSTNSKGFDPDAPDLEIVTCDLGDGVPEVFASAVVLSDLRSLGDPPSEAPGPYDVFAHAEAAYIVEETVDSIVDLLRGRAIRGSGGRIVGLIGCQYRHRRVAIGEAVQAWLTELGHNCAIEHRGLE